MSDNRTYQTKRMKVGAVEWQPELMERKPLPFVPDWFMGAVAEGYRHRLYGRIQFVGNSLQVVTDRGTAMAKPGDWVVFWSGLDDHLSVHGGEEFKKMFEQYDDERRPRIRSTTEKSRQRKPHEPV